jgi:DNA-binding transcriptional regulator YiaG
MATSEEFITPNRRKATPRRRIEASENHDLPTMSADELKALRASLGLTQEEMGKLMGVHLRTIQKWEGNETAIPGPAVLLAKIHYERANHVNE